MNDPNTPTGGDDKLKSGLGGLTNKKESELSTTLKQDKEYNGKENLIGDTDAILNDLRKNYVKIEENVEIMGYKGKKVHIELPAVGDFKGYKFECFISNNRLSKRDFEEKSELEKKSYSMSDISKLLQAINKYMIELKGENDGDVNYENELKYWEHGESENLGCNARDHIFNITGGEIHHNIWLDDKDVAGKKNSRAIRYGDDCDCYFSQTVSDFDIDAKLLLKLTN